MPLTCTRIPTRRTPSSKNARRKHARRKGGDFFGAKETSRHGL